LCHADFQGFLADFRLGWQKIPSVTAEIAGWLLTGFPLFLKEMTLADK
jgi:hypothetical protein